MIYSDVLNSASATIAAPERSACSHPSGSRHLSGILEHQASSPPLTHNILRSFGLLHQIRKCVTTRLREGRWRL